MKRTFKKLTSAFIAAAMAITALPQTATAEILPQEVGVTATKKSDSFDYTLSDDGEVNNIFINPVTHLKAVPQDYVGIYTVKDLDNIRNNLNTNYILMNDIDMSEIDSWVPINSFKKTFDGNGYTISNLTINDTVSYAGLFGSSGYVENLCLTNVNIDVKASTVGSVIAEGDAYNCCVFGTVKVSASTVGGVIGSGNAHNCYYSGNLECTENVRAGGVVGTGGAYYCYNLGNISSTGNQKQYYVGGVVGSNFVNSISCCYNAGNVTAQGKGSWTDASCGGIVGAISTNGVVSDSFNCGNISATSTYSSQVGGIVGTSYGAGISNCYNVGRLSAKGYPYVGGIIGITFDYIKLSNCYYLSTESEIAGSGNITAKVYLSYCDSLNISEFCSQDSFQGFDFDNTWTMEGEGTYLFPKLIGLPTNLINYGYSNHTKKQLSFENKFFCLDAGETKKLSVHIGDVTVENGEIIYSNDEIISNEKLDWFIPPESQKIIKINQNGEVTALSDGLAILLINDKDDLNLFTSCFVYVGDPNTFEFSGTYDTRQYYSNGGFYSQTSSLSDCVEIYLLFNNKFADELARIDYDPEKDSTNKELKSVAPITLTASVSGNSLSFERDSYKNTYTASFEEIQAGKAAHDLLMLFPTENLASNSLRTEYTVTVTLKSDSFDTVTEKYTFTIEPLETKNAKEHIACTINPDYLLSKKNLYGNTMVGLKDDKEYGWTKVTTFNFDNYYQIVLSDILMEMLSVNQKQAPSLVPSVVKEWYGTYKTLLGDITILVNDSYLENIDLSETAVDKLLKESKYVTNGIHTDDDVYQAVLDLLGTVDNVDKITKIFEKIDKTNQVFKMVKLGKNVIGDIMDWGNKLAVFNAFAESEQSLKTVMKHLADTIPASDYKMKEAVYDYINYSNDLGGQLEEVVESFYEMSGKVAIEAFNSFVGMSMIKYISIHLFNWICNHVTLEGGISVAASAAFPIVQTYFSAALVGVDLGLCLSDVLCNTSDISVEMSKTVAMSEFSPYIISTLNYYEAALYDAPNDDSVMVFEDAFFLHRAAQSYIMEHTVKSLETKRDSILIGLVGNLVGQGRGDYNEVISAVLAHKSVIDNLKCHSDTGETTAVTQTKVIMVRCPVNVFVYGQGGTETVVITDDEVEYTAEGTNVFVQNGEKYIALPADQTYSIKIVAFGDGVMEYRVDEYGDGGQCLKTVEKSEIPLVDGRVFTGQIVDQMNAEPESYALVYDGVTVVPDELSVLLGDVDGNEKINSVDARWVLQAISGKRTLTADQQAADVNNDGKINTTDAKWILQAVSGKRELN